MVQKFDAFINETSSTFVKKAIDKIHQNIDNGEYTDRDKNGNLLDKKGEIVALKLRRFDSEFHKRFVKEINAEPLNAKAMKIFIDNNLKDEIDWDPENEGGENHGIAYGFVEFEDWQFEVSGYWEWAGGYEYEMSDNIDFISPDGKTGEFFIND